jgi:hypothetical protein
VEAIDRDALAMSQIKSTELVPAIGDPAMPRDFISEDDLGTFEGWLRYQAVDAAALTPAELAIWRGLFDAKVERAAATPKLGRMKLRPLRAAEYRYAVAVDESDELWLVLWVLRNPKGEFFVMVPRDAAWDPHTSYHLDGAIHAKSYGQKLMSPIKRQSLTGAFRGRERLGRYAGYGPKSGGAIADPALFSGVVRLAPGVLGPRDGAVDVDLIEPGTPAPDDAGRPVVLQAIFREATPWVVITVCH